MLVSNGDSGSDAHEWARPLPMAFSPLQQHLPALPVPGGQAEFSYEAATWDYIPEEDEWVEEHGGYGRVAFEQLDAVRACRGEFPPYYLRLGGDDDDGNAEVCWVENSRWLAERQRYMLEHYRGFYAWGTDPEEMLSDFDHFMLVFHDGYVEAIAAGIWGDTSEDPVEGKPLPAGHPFLNLPEDAAVDHIDCGGAVYQVRAHKQPLEQVLSAIRLCSQPLYEFWLELDGAPTRAACRIEARGRHGPVGSVWRRGFGPVQGRREGIPSVGEATEWVMPWLVEEGERRIRKLRARTEASPTRA